MVPMNHRHCLALAASFLALCVAGFALAPVASAEQMYPDVVAVKARERPANTFEFDVTVSSPYDTPRRYAYGIRATAKDGAVLGQRKLFHDHASEQPFTRTLRVVLIPAAVRVVLNQARDSKYGYGGKTVEVTLPGC